jgi:CheY-like chemotaxis protein
MVLVLYWDIFGLTDGVKGVGKNKSGSFITSDGPLKNLINRKCLKLRTWNMTEGKFPEEHHNSTNIPTVLFASGEQQSRNDVSSLLERAGYKVITCANGAETIGFACRHRFDVILMDIKLPVIDGQETAKIIRSHGNNQNTPVVAVVDEDDKWIGVDESPFDDYIDKHVSQKVLLEVVNKYVQETQEIKNTEKSNEIICKIAAEDDYTKMIEQLICELPQWVAQMHKVFDKNNLQELQFQIQALKEQADSAGFEQWAQKMKDIEKIVYTEQIEKVNKKLDELVQMCVKTKLHRQTDES